jgi:hypothetical protein
MSGKLHKSAALTLGKESTVPTEWEAGWAPALVLAFWRLKKKRTENLLSLSETETQMVHPQHTLHHPGSYVFEIKVKVRLSLWLHAMREDVFSSGGMHHWCFVDGGEWCASCPSWFTAMERGPRTLWLGGRVGSRADMGAVVNRKIFDPGRMWVLMFNQSAHKPDTILNELSQLMLLGLLSRRQ